MNTQDHNRQHKIALINDFSGFGRCSIAVQLPIISTMGIQCCPVPTAIFSDHTGFESFYSVDFTSHMERYIEEWDKLSLRFEGIVSGFLGSAQQIEIVKSFLSRFKHQETIVLIDPVMGDYGKLYPSYSLQLSGQMHELLPYADIITPNLTEACILTGTTYREEMSDSELEELCVKLSTPKDGLKAPQKIVISGLNKEDYLGNFIFETGKDPKLMLTPRVGKNRSGTGDVFSAIIAADAVNGVDFSESVHHAASFIAKCLKTSRHLDLPLTDGLCFEEHLYELGKGKSEHETN
ncbi:MAG: pyridoxamine kinase [Lachnospiraceae bacterium]|nr:pyridoxamine kinase [Lachnospiraceae bacterium]